MRKDVILESVHPFT